MQNGIFVSKKKQKNTTNIWLANLNLMASQLLACSITVALCN